MHSNADQFLTPPYSKTEERCESAKFGKSVASPSDWAIPSTRLSYWPAAAPRDVWEGRAID